MRGVDFRLIRQLWLFLAVAEEQHFGRAAKKLGMSQPPLTEQIKLLEHALNLTLFERSRRGTKLSSAGLAILPAAKKFAEQVQHFELLVREVAAGQSGVLHIGAITSAMLESVPPVVEMLKQKYPMLTFKVDEIDSVEALPLLENGDIDLAFARLDGSIGEHIASVPLTEDKLAVAVPEHHPFTQQSSVSIKDLDQEQLVMFSRQVSPVYFDMVMSKCLQHGFAPRIFNEVRSVASQIAYVSSAQGIALVPSAMAKLAPSSVRVLSLKEDISLVTTAAAWNLNKIDPVLASAIDYLKQDALA